jgi:hypothetical protein
MSIPMTDEKPKLDALAASMSEVFKGNTNITKPVPPPMTPEQEAQASAQHQAIMAVMKAGGGLAPLTKATRDAPNKPDSTPEQKAELTAGGATFTAMQSAKNEEQSGFAAREAIRRAQSKGGKGLGE